MKSRIATTCFVVGAALTSFAVLAADADTDRTHPAVFVKDSAITMKVKARLADEKLATLAQVQVDTEASGAVSLSGRARSQDDADRAVSIARATEGVTSVHSTIKVKKDD